MFRVSVAERGRLAWLVLQRGFDHLAGRLVSHPLVQMWRWPRAAARLVIAPQDLRTADPTRASEIHSGRFALAGKVVVCDGRSPFDGVAPSREWAEALLSFNWLRHLRAADNPVTRANARALVDEWIDLQGSWHATAWRPEIIARRLIAWMAHAKFILSDADVRFYRRFVRSLIRQVWYLRCTARDARDGVPRLRACIALAYAALCITGQERHLAHATKRLAAELDRQVLPDGGHASRNPGALIELLAELLPLSQAFSARNVPPPRQLIHAIDRMMPMLRFFRHSDGAFALFNGMGPTPTDLLATVLAYDDARGTPVANAVHSGYQRIEAGGSVVIMDTGRPPPATLSADAHAGTLALELSSGQHRIVVNCGLPATAREDWQQFARATAAHSTVTFHKTSCCRFLAGAMLRRAFGALVVQGPRSVRVAREAGEGSTMVAASHDGYGGRFGIVHQRTIVLSQDGGALDGEDRFLPAKGDAPPAQFDDFAVRFHLHPLVRVEPAEDARSAVLALPNKETWLFEAHAGGIELEDGAFLAGQGGPRRSVQLVIHGRAGKSPCVRWTFARLPPSSAPRRRTGLAEDDGDHAGDFDV